MKLWLALGSAGRSLHPAGRALVVFLGAAWLASSPAAAGTVAWPVTNAWGCVRVERTKHTPWPASVGYAQVWPGGADPTKCNAAVFTAGGRKVNSQVLWAAPGEPLKVVFDTSSGEITYDIYLCEGPRPETGWRPEAGVILETRTWKGGSLDTWDKAWQGEQSSKPVLGRSVLPNIFLGIHPHGPTANFAGYYSAWFSIKKSGSYEFAVMSSGPAWLRIDGKPVAARAESRSKPGRRGENNGSVMLSAGKHQMEFLFLDPSTGEWMVEAAWKPPEHPFAELMGENDFLPIARFETFSFQAAPGRSDRGYFEWETLAQNVMDRQTLLTVHFRTAGARKETGGRWQFDDGTEATGSPVTHVFAQTGLRRVQFTAEAGGEKGSSLTEWVNIQPNWSQQEEWRDTLFDQQKKQLLGTDFSRAPMEDLGALVKIADSLHDQKLLSYFGGICLKRQADFKPAQANVLYLLGFHYAEPEVRDYPKSEKCWRAALAIATPSTGVHEQAKVQLAHLLTDAFGKPDEALALLKSANETYLRTDDVRRASLFQGDALLALGKVEEAAKVYRAAGNLVDTTNRLRSVRGIARVESARDLIRRGEYDAADEILRQAEWETPLERLSAETGLLMVRVHLGRKEYPLALSRCQRLLYSATVDTQHAEVLYCLIETELALDRPEAAQEALARLVKDHPYSEAAARAKDRWGSHGRSLTLPP